MTFKLDTSAFQDVLNGVKPKYDIEHRIIRQDNGEIRFVRAIGEVAERSELGEPLKMFGFAEDITERKKAEIALRESEEKYRSMFVNMLDGFAYHKVLFDENSSPTDYIFQEVNDRFEEYTGLVREDIIGKKVTEIIPEIVNAEPDLIAIYGQVAKSGRSTQFEVYFQPFDKYYSVSSYSPHKGYFVSLFHDITERKLAEEALKARQLEIEKLNTNLEERVAEEVEKSRQKDLIMIHQSRLAAMGEMIGLIAHQWKQPLNALNLLLYNIKDICEEHRLSDEAIDELFDKGVNLIMKMSSTIDDFRNFFRPNRGKETFNINKIIKDSYSMIDASFKYSNIQVSLHEEEELIAIGYPNEYSQVILNILNNAKDAILSKCAHGEIVIDVSHKNHSAVVNISDNGGGIPDNILSSIFDPYFTTREEGKGAGMGLYMSKVIIEDHMDGHVEVHNTNDGAEFSIKTPLAHSSKINQPQ